VTASEQKGRDWGGPPAPQAHGPAPPRPEPTHDPTPGPVPGPAEPQPEALPEHDPPVYPEHDRDAEGPLPPDAWNAEIVFDENGVPG
jgi:hypothetical protein